MILNTRAADEMTGDWYERRNELEPDQVFRMYDNSIVRLDYRVPGDGSAWRVIDWSNGWFHYDRKIEPSDLTERLPDDFGAIRKATGKS